MKKTSFIAGAMTAAMLLSTAPATVSAQAKTVKPGRVAVTSVKRVSSTKSTVKWKKLKKNVSGYAVYVKKGSSGWKQTKVVGRKTSSVTFTTDAGSKYQVRVRAYKKGKKTRYYNKKAKRYVSKKTYKRLARKSRRIKKVSFKKWGSYSSVKTINAVFSGQVQTVNASFDGNEDAALSWNASDGADKYEVYRSEGGEYQKIATVTETSYTDKYYNPTTALSYKIRPVKGSTEGVWSEAVSLDPTSLNHNWSVSQENRQVGAKKVEETHDICNVCGMDLHDMTEAVLKYADEHGLTGPDAVDAMTNPMAVPLDEHMAKHEAEGAKNWGSTHTEIVTVEKPVYATVTVYKCSDCGMERIAK